VTTANEQFALRSPGWVRAFGAAFALAWVYPAFVHPPSGDDFLVPGAIIAVLVVAFVIRTSVSSVVGTADGWLTVRNIWSTRTFRREDIYGVGIDRADGGLGHGRGWALFLVLADGSRRRPTRSAPGSTACPRRSADHTRHAPAGSTDLYGSG
jgi:hypothetical protein